MKKLILLLPLFLLFACDDKDGDKSKDKDKSKETENDSTKVVETPVPMLGEAVAMAIGTQHFDESVKFYASLGFEEQASGEEGGHKWVQLFDGSLQILIMQEDEMKYMGPIYYTSKGDEVFAQLKELGVTYFAGKDGSDGQAIVISPDSVGFSVLAMPMDMPEVKNVAAIWGTMDLSLIEYPNPVMGTFQEFSRAVDNLESSVAYWEKLGFASTGTMPGPYPFTIMYDGLMILGLHQAGDMWHGQVITYSGESAEQVQKAVDMAKENGYSVMKVEMEGMEGMDPGYLISDPDGNMIYLGSDFKKQEAES